MRQLAFRTPTRCQNGHFRFYYWTAVYGRILTATWGPKEPECKCPTHELSEGFKQCGKDQQWTGLHDRNGIDIYEGDTIQQHPSSKYLPATVAWDEEIAGFDLSKSAEIDYEVVEQFRQKVTEAKRRREQ